MGKRQGLLAKYSGSVAKTRFETFTDKLLHYYYGADVNDSLGHPFYYARSPEMIDLLVSFGADVNLQNRFGLTALHAAAWAPNCYGLIQRLVAHGADLSVQNREGNAALAWASSDAGGELGCAALLDFGATWSPKNGEEGYTRQLISCLRYVERHDLIDKIRNCAAQAAPRRLL